MAVRFEISPDLALMGLRAMKAAALADGALSRQERALLEVVAREVGLEVDLDALPIIEPVDLALAIVDPALRTHVVRGMILTALMDERITIEEASLVARYARALGVDEPRVANLRQVACERFPPLRPDLARRSFARPIFARAWRERGVRGIWKIVAPMFGMGADPELARHYRALRELPDGTLGRAYCDFIERNQLGYPGEGVVAEEGVWHDLTHVLAGYDTQPEGEVDVVSFIAGYSRSDPFFWLFTIALQFHLGIDVSPYSPKLTGHFHPSRVLAAFRRGLAVTRDLGVGWDYHDDLALPLDEVRRKYGVGP